jgi:XapX domain-containing protein
MKIALALLIAFGIGFGCGWFKVPTPAPPTLIGAAFVMMMTIGFMTATKLRPPAAVAPVAARQENTRP